jgi:hypothetical protein
MRKAFLKKLGFVIIALSSSVPSPQSEGARETSVPPSASARVSVLEGARPAEILRAATVILIRSKSTFFKPASLEQDLLNREVVQDWGLIFTRDELDADLILEVDRKRFTNAFVYSVIDPKTRTTLLGGKIGSLGGSVEKQIGDHFVRKMQRFRGAQMKKA